MALEGMGAQLKTHTVELDPLLRSFVQGKREVATENDVLTMDTKQLVTTINQTPFDVLVLIGGPRVSPSPTLLTHLKASWTPGPHPLRLSHECEMFAISTSALTGERNSCLCRQSTEHTFPAS